MRLFVSLVLSAVMAVLLRSSVQHQIILPSSDTHTHQPTLISIQVADMGGIHGQYLSDLIPNFNKN
jgi:hypothetical protein